jgi:hypothetical protein
MLGGAELGVHDRFFHEHGSPAGHGAAFDILGVQVSSAGYASFAVSVDSRF